MRRYGWAAWKGHFSEWEKLLEEVKTSGFDYVEISLDYPLPTKKELLKEVVAKAREKGLEVAFHAPWRGIDLATPWEPLRKGAVDVIKMGIDIAAEFGAAYIVYHVTTSEKLTDDVKDAVFEAGLRSVAEVSEYAAKQGVIAAVENVGSLGQPDYFGRLRDETDAFFCFDVGHALTSFMKRHKLKLDEVDVDEMIEVWKNAIGGRTVCAHLHGVTGEGKLRSHQPLVYPITKRVAAKAYVMMGAEYVTFEVYYNKGKEVGPRFVAKELKDVTTWEKVYKEPKAARGA